MTQRLSGLGFGGAGTAGLLIVAGILLKITGVNQSLGDLALALGIIFAVIFGLLGVAGISKRL